ncbi:hypothetical protein PIB30_074470 [Stylosanthes scabra]|uniref:Uncharacterized protein n=1 Tax=Stylosanthes scabra TaxID=79078 RepID=A0ABU6XRU7_9FABA|nr:hypothetical protein [Stylosanthes scabra]
MDADSEIQERGGPRIVFNSAVNANSRGWLGSVDGDGGDSAVNAGEKFGWWWMVRLFGWPKVVDGEVASAVLLGGCSELWWVWWRRTKVNSAVVECGGSRVSDGRFGWLMDVWVR